MHRKPENGIPLVLTATAIYQLVVFKGQPYCISSAFASDARPLRLMGAASANAGNANKALSMDQYGHGQNLWLHFGVDEHPFAILKFTKGTGFWPTAILRTYIHFVQGYCVLIFTATTGKDLRGRRLPTDQKGPGTPTNTFVRPVIGVLFAGFTENRVVAIIGLKSVPIILLCHTFSKSLDVHGGHRPFGKAGKTTLADPGCQGKLWVLC